MSSPVVSADEVARRLRLQQPLTEDVRWAIDQAIWDAQADVEAYLGQPVTPTTFIETGLVAWPGGWQLTNAPLISIVAVTAETDPDSGVPTGLYTVEYTAGIDAINDPTLAPIRRYVIAHAKYSPEVQLLLAEESPAPARRVASLTAEGQSVTYEADPDTDSQPGSGAPGALPLLSSLDRWRIAGRRVFQRPTDPASIGAWPYDYYRSCSWWW
jgi:hypothetical protein